MVFTMVFEKPSQHNNIFLNRGLFGASSKTSRHQFATFVFLNYLKSVKRLGMGGLGKKWSSNNILIFNRSTEFIPELVLIVFIGTCLLQCHCRICTLNVITVVKMNGNI